MSAVDAAALREEYARSISRGGVRQLHELGHDFVEAAAEGSYLIDETGRRYLDCYSGAGIFNLGRRPPAITAALRGAMRVTDQGNFPMISIEKARVAEQLARFVPGPTECTVFGVVRGEAFDFACKLARGFTGKTSLVAPPGSWFGQTGFALSLSAHPHRGDFGNLVPGARVEVLESAADVARVVTDDTAAVFVEPFQAENHCASLPQDVLSALADRCHKKGAVLVADETQTGFGRTGRRFAFEHFGLEPEAVILGEALGAGVFPICGTILSQRLNGFMNAHPLIHLSTFGGSDLGCVVASAALAEYERTRPWENAARQGTRIRDALEAVADPAGNGIRSVVGVGLLISLDLGDPDRAVRFCKALAAAGVFVKPGRVATRTVVLRPPLTISDDDVAHLVDAVKQVC